MKDTALHLQYLAYFNSYFERTCCAVLQKAGVGGERRFKDTIFAAWLAHKLRDLFKPNPIKITT